MKIYQELLVFYDISDTKLRTKIHNSLKDFGLYPIQKSTFWGHVLHSDVKSIQRLFNTINDGDKIALVKSDLEKNHKENSRGLDEIVLKQHPDKYDIF